MQKFLEPNLILSGDFASLEPLNAEHEPELIEAARDGALWELEFTIVPSPQTAAQYIQQALASKAAGQQQPFVVRRLSDNKIIGCTRFYEMQQEHRNLSIGYTWYAHSAQRTAINTECKKLLLAYAFEQLNCISVMFHTDDQNVRSQAAITRLGAKKDGVLRNHRIVPSGRYRHTWQYSIIDSEWPEIKANLEEKLRLISQR